jgi:hypothetical protein
MSIEEKAIGRAVREALARLPPEALDIPTLVSISVKKRSESGSLAGLTRRITYERRFRLGPAGGREDEMTVQKIELYSEVLLQLSEMSRVAVVAHEIAHAWLNDNLRPEDSEEREMKSDELARSWGFGAELDALADETY